MNCFPPLRPLLVVLALVGAGCRDTQVAHYRVDKSPLAPSASASASAASPAPAPVATAPTAATTAPGSLGPAAAPADSALHWTAPAHWTAQPTTGVRVATYSVVGDGGTAELAVTRFPGAVGGELANLNRWRGQVGLPPWTEAERDAAVRRLTVNGLAVTVSDFTGRVGDAPTRLLAAIVPQPTETWFFKFTGAPAVLEAEAAAFQALLESLNTTGGDDACCAH